MLAEQQATGSSPVGRTIHKGAPIKNWSVYILQCADQTYYTGVTNDLEKRLQTHNLGRGARYTAGRRPVKLVYHQDDLTESQAKKSECALKKLSRKEKEKVICLETRVSVESKKLSRVDIKLPKKSIKLAEFVGIMIGDGGITDYQITITLHRINDKNYSIFVIKLLKELFRIEPNKNYRQSVVNIRISRKNLVGFCQKIGLKKGNKIKQSVDIPDWIKANNKYSISCLRGLVDTDGSVYNHRYISKNKQYTYKNISFTSRSPALLSSTKSLLEQIGLKPKYGSRSDIKLYDKADIISYFKIVGSNNPKHIIRFK